MNRKFLILIVCTLLFLFRPDLSSAREQWTVYQANDWYRQKPELIGCNFIPSTAINELEMWQADTFDPTTIDRELGWAQGLGFNSTRVFLHNIPWDEDSQGYIKRIDQFLQIADKHHIGVVFVLLDSCWDPFPKAGKQHEPTPHRHNSGWVQAPGLEILKDPSRHAQLAPYIKGVVGHFKDDRRIHAWDVFNEPDNMNKNSYGRSEPANKPELALTLIKEAYQWAREADPSQPLTSGVWIGAWPDPAKLSSMEHFQLEQSDIISFHNYAPLPQLKEAVEHLRRYNRPMLCTEYMARPAGSTFDPNLGYLASQKVGAYNWGFVSGKSQTIYPWDSWQKQYTAEPPLWFHDIFRSDGTPYDLKEVQYIRTVTGKLAAAQLIQQGQDGTILLLARDVTVHGATVRYEPQPNKNTVGYWTRKDDWVSWDFAVARGGKFQVTALQGCGKGSGGSEVEFAVANQKLKMTVQDTGGFQNFIPRTIGTVDLSPGHHTLTVTPLTKPGLAVMDLRSVTLKPS